ncbi:hypothetical protein [Arthrobacter sp. 4R501]|uniref:hypothetical protein n=1 Tax=Arthrobacter sp. 4R501 TaxID=2058886 RepID=UPI000CE47103|nr:hypothetical protein [Arthrobacter sp. 4R501]
MTTQTPEPTAPAPETNVSPEAPLTFEAPPPAAPGAPNPIPRGIPWGEPITPATKQTEAGE